MVLLHFKIAEKNQFIYSVPATTPITDIIKGAVEINNLRCKIDTLCMVTEELIKHGPLKPEEYRGLKETENLDENIEPQYRAKKTPFPEKVGTKYNEDKTNQRTGWILEDDINKKIMEAVKEAKEYLDPKRAESRKITTSDELNKLIQLMYGGVMIGYPAYHGLGEWEPCRVIFEDKSDILQKDEPNQDYFQFDTTCLWYAGKELERGKLLSDYIGKNEKTKVVVKFTKKGSGAPVREPLIDKETHSKMLQYYYKKQEEEKKLQNENEDSYLDSQWADPKQMEKQLYMNGDIKWKYH
jgi:hypothetical protein